MEESIETTMDWLPVPITCIVYIKRSNLYVRFTISRDPLDGQFQRKKHTKHMQANRQLALCL